IYYHGRWDDAPATWWAGSGFKINVGNLQSLSLNLGPNTTWPYAAVGISINGAPFFTVNATQGENVIPLPNIVSRRTSVRFNVQGWQNNRINLQSLYLNWDAALLPYEPTKRTFQFIGDSLSAGQYLPLGVDQAWPFLVGEHYKAEHRINAQPGATLTDMESYGNVHGVSYQFFKTEDTGYIWSWDHNYTTPWNFKRDQPPATHIVIHIGANDASHGVPPEDFTKVYLDFISKIRKINSRAPIFVLTPWGWPNADGNVYYYYDGVYKDIVSKRRALGDRNIYLVDATGWVSWDDIFPDNGHPNVPGHQVIAKRFINWLEKWSS
ncbi:SGNH hydrolase-type esterase domain-containing protein, partial [Panaeolus papilionaceus]